ncbi:hypothetical protein [Paenibacillus tyrfis]|uniref:hypothetical protein n=1 Tax=Paenibacillus tyrfis TaxID=1501230 RepID=UPI00209D28F5|nr:hypothetical protein [Paenibacillus tyrfis]MCP1311396.1 hypothetical protein [Paenibacillus tyrfis]
MNEIGIGKVTMRGIVFNGLHYSCDTAIRHQWFEKARTSGEWMVLVISTKSNLDKILLIEPHSKMLLVCNIIQPNSVSGVKLEKYFNSIQKLKAKRSLRPHKKTPRANNPKRSGPTEGTR